MPYIVKGLRNNEYSNVTRYQVNIQNSTVFLCSMNKQVVVKNFKVPFKIAPKIVQLCINLTKYVKYLNVENYKTSIKKAMI